LLRWRPSPGYAGGGFMYLRLKKAMDTVRVGEADPMFDNRLLE
jgi:hypothetical protein